MSQTSLAVGVYDLDEPLLELARSQRRAQLKIYRVDRTLVVLGRGSKPAAELQLDACHADRVPVLRRRGGGCSVVIDPGNVIVSIAFPVVGLRDNKRHIEHISSWLADALTAVGVAGIRRQGVSDLVCGDRKVSGSCIHRSRDLLYFSATLLVNPNVDQMERYLAHPPREPGYRAQRHHARFVGRIVAPGIDSAEDLERALVSLVASGQVPPLDDLVVPARRPPT